MKRREVRPKQELNEVVWLGGGVLGMYGEFCWCLLVTAGFQNIKSEFDAKTLINRKTAGFIYLQQISIELCSVQDELCP